MQGQMETSHNQLSREQNRIQLLSASIFANLTLSAQSQTVYVGKKKIASQCATDEENITAIVFPCFFVLSHFPRTAHSHLWRYTSGVTIATASDIILKQKWQGWSFCLPIVSRSRWLHGHLCTAHCKQHTSFILRTFSPSVMTELTRELLRYARQCI